MGGEVVIEVITMDVTLLKLVITGIILVILFVLTASLGGALLSFLDTYDKYFSSQTLKSVKVKRGKYEDKL